MNIIKFNGVGFEVSSYNKYTSFSGENMAGTAACQIKADNITALQTLGKSTITSIQILHDEVVIYDLVDVSAKITNINEYLSNDKIDVTINLEFN